jgi:NTE family protein
MPNGQRLLFHHLASRSPWRRKNSRSMEIPRRPGLVALVIDELPRLGPFALEHAPAAFAAARDATHRALDTPIHAQAVRVSAKTAGAA